MSKDRILVKDCGFGTQLTVHVGSKLDGDPLWSARFNATNPNAVIQTHLDFLEGGADIIVTNTYQASVEGYTEYLGLDAEKSIELIKKTVRLAHVAREKFLTEHGRDSSNSKDIPMIIASIGPYGAHLHDGSEYSGNYADLVSAETIKKWHRFRIDAVLAAGVDALAIETIPCQVEAEALADLLCDEYRDVKFWMSFQCKDGSSLVHGESFAQTSLSVWNKFISKNIVGNCLAVGINCVHPKFVTPLFTSLNGNRKPEDRLPLVVYPNSGEIYDVKTGWTGRENCTPLESYVPEWIDLGVKIIGGCCRTYVPDIQRIKNAIAEHNK